MVDPRIRVESLGKVPPLKVKYSLESIKVNANTKTNPVLGLISGLSAAAIWGGMYVVSKVVMGVVPPFLLIVMRLLLGILTLGIILIVRRDWSLTWARFWRIFGVGTVGYGVSLGFQFEGTKLSTAANGSLVTSATPAFVLLFAALLLSEKITRWRLLALLVATLGVVAVIDRNTDVLTTTLVAFIGGLPICIPLGSWELATVGIGRLDLGMLAGILFLGIISTALAMYLWNTAFAVLDAGTASLTFFAQPLVGTLLSVLFLKEQITPLFILGGILIGIALLIASRT